MSKIKKLHLPSKQKPNRTSLIVLDLDEKNLAKAKAFAKARGISLNDWINLAVEAYIIETIEDDQLAAIVKEREDNPMIDVDIEDL